MISDFSVIKFLGKQDHRPALANMYWLGYQSWPLRLLGGWNNYKQILLLIGYEQFPKMNMDHILNKPYVNGVILKG